MSRSNLNSRELEFSSVVEQYFSGETRQDTSNKHETQKI